MKKTNILYIIVIGLLLFIPFVRVSVAAPPCWVGAIEDETYIWQYNNHTAAAFGDWTDDDVVTTLFTELGAYAGMATELVFYGSIPGNMSHEITAVSDLGPDLQFGTNYESVLVSHAVVWNTTAFGYEWTDKDGISNVWEALVLDNETEFVLFNNGLAMYFDSYEPNGWSFARKFVSNNLDWTAVAAAANTELAGTDATVTALADGFEITIAAEAWETNTKAIGLKVTFEDGLLNTWDLTYGTDTILDVDLVQGSSEFTPCPSDDVIPGYELPIIIGVATVSIISLILIKKIKKK